MLKKNKNKMSCFSCMSSRPKIIEDYDEDMTSRSNNSAGFIFFILFHFILHKKKFHFYVIKFYSLRATV